MSSLVQTNVSLTSGQLAKLKSGHKNRKSVVLRLSHSQLHGKHSIHIGLEQFKRLESARKSKAKRGVEVQFSPQQIGGFLPALLALLPAIGSFFTSTVAPALVAGASSALGGLAVNKIAGNGLNIPSTMRGKGASLPLKKKVRRGKGLLAMGQAPTPRLRRWEGRPDYQYQLKRLGV